MAIKSNRKIALTLEDKQQDKFVSIETLKLEQNTTQLVYLKNVEFPVLLIKQVFKNKDRSSGVLYLVSSDINLTYNQIIAIYQKRWNVEVFHKSQKSNTALGKSQTKTVRTQKNHFLLQFMLF